MKDINITLGLFSRKIGSEKCYAEFCVPTSWHMQLKEYELRLQWSY